MSSPRVTILFLLGLLLLATLACGLPIGDAADVAPAVATAEAAAREAGRVAQTAAAQAGNLVGTASALATSEGPSAIATVKAAATPFVDYLKEKMDSIEPDAEGSYQVALTEDEVNNVLRIRQLLGGDVLGAGIQSQKVTFSDGIITLSGSIIEPLPGQLLVSMRPIVEDGRLQLDILDASVAGREAPPQALESAENAISGALSEALKYVPNDVRLQEIRATDGQLIIIGRKTEPSG